MAASNCRNFAGLVTNPPIAFLTVTTMRQDNQRIIPVIQIPPLARIFSDSSMHIYSVCRCKYLPVWHLAPAYPGRQLQTYLLTWSVHVPPLKQGLLEHSLMSAKKRRFAWNLYFIYCYKNCTVFKCIDREKPWKTPYRDSKNAFLSFPRLLLAYSPHRLALSGP